MARRDWFRPALAALLLAWVPATAGAAETCNEWHAVYAGDADDDGGRVLAAFGRSDGSNPQAFTLTGVDGDGTRLWQHRSIAWCFQGAGGCHMSLRWTDGVTTDPEDSSDDPHRLVFARAGPDSSGVQRYTLVISDLSNAFLDGQRPGNKRWLALERFDGSEEIVIAPEVFYFERCIDE